MSVCADSVCMHFRSFFQGLRLVHMAAPRVFPENESMLSGKDEKDGNAKEDEMPEQTLHWTYSKIFFSYCGSL